jgi:hypothetical protein
VDRSSFLQMVLQADHWKVGNKRGMQASRITLWMWTASNPHLRHGYIPTTVMSAPYILARDVVVAAA